MFILKYYLLFTALTLIAAIYTPQWYFKASLIWLSMSLAAVSFAYISDSPKIFRKKSDGHIPWYIQWLFVPFLTGAQIYNSWARKNDSVPAVQKIEDNLYLACRLFPSDSEFLKQENITAVLDATAEFSGFNLSAQLEEFSYFNVAVLDHKVPHKKDLLEAVNWIHNQIRQDKSIVIHCALGRGRSVLIMAAYLLFSKQASSVDDALNKINKIRSTAKLNHFQYKKLKQLFNEGLLQQKQDLLLVVNPVSGGGKWELHHETIVNILSHQYTLHIVCTSEEKDATTIVKENLSSKHSAVIACGGDGTVNEVIEAVMQSVQLDKVNYNSKTHTSSTLTSTTHTSKKSELSDKEYENRRNASTEAQFQSNTVVGIIPIGTTNALSHVLYGSLAKIRPIETACQCILNNNRAKIDIAKCNDEHFLLVAGLGYEQEMIENADRDKKDELGELAYLSALYESIKRNNSQTFSVFIDDDDEQIIQANSIVIANAAPFTTILAQGKGEPDPFDAYLDLTIVNNEENSVMPFATLSARALFTPNKKHDNDDSLHHKRIKRIRIKKTLHGKPTAEEKREAMNLKYVVDGESRSANEIKIEVLPKAVSVFTRSR